MKNFLIAFLLLPKFLSAFVETDYAIFLFDNGDKNMVASMLEFAQDEAKSLDFRIVFMGGLHRCNGKRGAKSSA